MAREVWDEDARRWVTLHDEMPFAEMEARGMVRKLTPDELEAARQINAGFNADNGRVDDYGQPFGSRERYDAPSHPWARARLDAAVAAALNVLRDAPDLA